MRTGGGLPSIKALRTFVAVANHLSFSRAADELCVTQGAVSKQIASLEQQLGQALVKRGLNGIELTSEGLRYLPEVTQALEMLQHATASLLQSDTDQERLVIDVTPSFASLWLVPHLDDFQQRYPLIRVEVRTGDGPVLHNNHEFDLSVRCLPLSAHYEHARLLCEERLVLIGPPTMPERYAITDYPFIPQTTRPQLWEQFKQEQSFTQQVGYQPVGFEHFYLSLEAVKRGKGLALLPDFMTQAAIAQAQVTHVQNLSMQSHYGYYVIVPNHRLAARKVYWFHEWLKQKLTI
ncbi:LysR family transcriptional regulator [Vibrio sp. CAU 1672]|uniref:LysR family transcriptional regulator n=1 Tax=Vibrio sp. CAU 1672 TaxID=3032594 RepID=UPI0023DBCA5C|nr:LysR family transcriptional regulator [Vibrio sp. CAU 1672]MDF2155033.1 LysR family transcriptional regulator [Vibrio sp. CAU 1672]